MLIVTNLDSLEEVSLPTGASSVNGLHGCDIILQLENSITLYIGQQKRICPVLNLKADSTTTAVNFAEETTTAKDKFSLKPDVINKSTKAMDSTQLKTNSTTANKTMDSTQLKTSSTTANFAEGTVAVETNGHVGQYRSCM